MPRATATTGFSVNSEPLVGAETDPAPLRRRADWENVTRALDEFCVANSPGTPLPSHAEWMARLDASERAVRRAVEELRRRGKVVTRQGARTFVAERAAPTKSEAIRPGKALVEVFAQPDQGFYDRAIELLFGLAGDFGLSISLHPVQPGAPELPVTDTAPCYIFLGRQFLPVARAARAAGARVVLLGTPNTDERAEVANVCFDHERGGFLATRHLLDLGHSRLAFLGEASDLATPRWRGHAKALDAAARRGRPVAIARLDRARLALWKSRPDLVAEYFLGPEAPTGVVAWNDQEALPLLGLLAHAGIRVPRDVSVIGHDNLPASELVFPRLTTVEISMEEQLAAALAMLTGPHPPTPDHTAMVVPFLVARDSTGPATMTAPARLPRGSSF